LIHPFNDPLLIAGHGTVGLEIIEQVPDLDAIIVPIGAGSGVCGSAIVMKTVNPDIRVIGVQAEGFPAVYESWRQKELVSLDAGQSFAEGLAARVAFELPLKIINELVDDIVLVSDREMCQGIVDLVEGAHLVAEGAGAASMAAAIASYRDKAAIFSDLAAGHARQRADAAAELETRFNALVRGT
jgi:threonine dehydratase